MPRIIKKVNKKTNNKDNEEQNKIIEINNQKIKKKTKKEVEPEIIPTILEDNKLEILYIAHTSDIHIRRCEKIEEYKGVFNNLFKNLKSKNLNKNNSLIVVCGDILHDTIMLHANSVDLCKEFFYGLTEITSVICFIGNHEFNRNNLETNNLASIIKKYFATNNQLFMLEKTGLYVYNNLIFGYTHVDSKDIIRCNVSGDNLTKTKIGLYHGMVTSELNKNELYFAENTVDVDSFKDYDLVMLGDIHKMHFLNEEKTIAYSGSLIQQNKGESIEKGYLLWDVKKLSAEFVRIHNDYGTLKIVINKNGKWKEPKKLDIPKYVKLDIVCNSEDNADIESVYKYFDDNSSVILEKYEKFENKNRKIDNIIIKGQKNNIDILRNKDKLYELICNSLDKTFQNESIKQKILNIINDVDIQETQTKNIKLIKLTFSNFMKYGVNNEINFESLSNINGIFADNGSAKSSLIDAIIFSIYGEATRGTNSDLINNNAKSAQTEIILEVNGIKYKITRKLTRNKKDKFERSAASEFSFFENDENITDNIIDKEKPKKKNDKDTIIDKEPIITETDVESMASNKKKKNTNNQNKLYLEDKICSIDYFLKNCIITQNNKNTFLSLTSKEQKKYIFDLFNAKILDDIHTKASLLLKQSKAEFTKKISKLTDFKEYETNENLIKDIINDKLIETINNSEELKKELNILLLTKDNVNKDTIILQSNISLNNNESLIKNINVSEINLKNINLEKEKNKLNLHLTNLTNKINNKKKLIDTKNYEELYNDFMKNKENEKNLINIQINELRKKIINDTSFDIKKNNTKVINTKLKTLNEELLKINNKVKQLKIDIENYNKIITQKFKKVNETKYKLFVDKQIRIEKINNELEDIEYKININLESSKHLEDYEYDPECKFCVKNCMTKQKLLYDSELLLLNNNKSCLLKELNELETYITKNKNIEEEYLNSNNKEKDKNDASVKKELLLKELELNNIKVESIEKDISYNKTILEKLSLYQENDKIKTQIQTLEQKIEDLYKSKCDEYENYNIINKELVILNDKINETTKQLNKILEDINKNTNLIDTYNKNIDNIKKIENLKVKNSELDDIQTRIKKLEMQIYIFTKEINKLESDKVLYTRFFEELTILKEIKNDYEIIHNFTSSEDFTQKIMEDSILPSITSEFNNLLQKYVDFKVKIILKGDSIFFYKEDGSNLTMSGGFETHLLDIIFRLIFAQIATSIKSNFFIIDEAFDNADYKNKDNMINLINFMNNTFDWMIIISHDLSIVDKFEHMIQIVSIDGSQKLKCL